MLLHIISTILPWTFFKKSCEVDLNRLTRGYLFLISFKTPTSGLGTTILLSKIPESLLSSKVSRVKHALLSRTNAHDGVPIDLLEEPFLIFTYLDKIHWFIRRLILCFPTLYFAGIAFLFLVPSLLLVCFSQILDLFISMRFMKFMKTGSRHFIQHVYLALTLALRGTISVGSSMTEVIIRNVMMMEDEIMNNNNKSPLYIII